MRRPRFKVLGATAGVAALAVIAAILGLTGLTGSAARADRALPGYVKTPGESDSSIAATPGVGPNAAEAYLSAERTYPANVIPASFVQNAAATFDRIANQPDNEGGGGEWNHYGPLVNAIQPGILSFTGATTPTASRITALAISPNCRPGDCPLYAGASGGGVWRTEDATAPNPAWHQVTHDLAQNSVGTLVIDPTDPTGRTLYLGTGEPNRCSSGCEAGVGIYKSTNGGDSWQKLDDTCVSNPTYACATPGQDSFLGRGISAIVVDPTNPQHLFVGSALAVRGLSHVIGNGGTSRFEPGANAPGLYESFDGGSTFTEVWNGSRPVSFGINDVKLDPLDPTTVYASAFDAGLWRRSPTLDGSATPYDFHQVYSPNFVPPACTPDPKVTPACGFLGIDRTMFAPTVKNGTTRIYLTEGTQNVGSSSNPLAATFWRTDNANQPAATLLGTEASGSTEPPPTTVGPQTYPGWQKLTSKSTASPYYATTDFCTAQCWYDEYVYTPKGMPDTVYVIGSYLYGEQPCNTKGVACGNGRSNGRAVLYSTTAGDPEPVTTADGTTTTRTFTDLTFDAQNQPADWCSYGSQSVTTPGFECLWAPDGIHPDQHSIVINPNNPTQIFEGSDGGVVRTDGNFADISQHCNSNERPLLGPASLNNCKRLLSRVPNLIEHVDKFLASTLQFVGVSINPQQPCEVQGGTQDNGTWTNNDPECARGTWPQTIYGDGGNGGFDATNGNWRFNEFTGGFSDSNFENGVPAKWVITSAPLVNSNESVAFYWPQIADPNPLAGTHPIFAGLQHVWRTWAFGAGTPNKTPQDTTPNIAFYEANCGPDWTTAGNDPRCGDYQPLGGPQGSNQPGDLTGTVYGSDRTGGSVSWLARDRADHQTLWAATSAGRIFVTHNANAVDPKAVVWHRIDNPTSPTRFPSSIYIDPSDASHAWVTYSGYNAVTPTTPGHVFSVVEGDPATPGSGVFTNLNVESGTSAFPTPTNDGDLPVSDVVRDDQTHTLYVGTDFGVLKGRKDGTRGWVVMSGLPRYEIMHLAIEPSNRDATCAVLHHCPRVLYAATHSQGIWSLRLGGEGG
ncbi:MAG TPA: hypothetical protein VF002_00810 [Gaiellaceae bacterium]